MKYFTLYLMLFMSLLLFNSACRTDQSNLWDNRLYTKASVVIRAKVIERGGGSKYWMTKVKLLDVFKKPKGTKLPTEFWLNHYSFGNGIPDGILTLYLVPFNETDPGFAWKLLEECKRVSEDLRCSDGFSHQVSIDD